MPGADLRELASYVTSCSLNSLGKFFLQRLDRASHLEHDLRKVARELVQSLALAELADLFLHHGEEIIATNSVAVKRAPSPAPPRPTAVAPKPANKFRFWWDAQDAVVASFLSTDHYAVCMAIVRSVGMDVNDDPKHPYPDDGYPPEAWTPLDGEHKCTNKRIAARAGTSEEHVRSLLRYLRTRRVLVAEYHNKQNIGEVVRYRLNDKVQWLWCTKCQAKYFPRTKCCCTEEEKQTPKGVRPEKTREEARWNSNASSGKSWSPITAEKPVFPTLVQLHMGTSILNCYPKDGSGRLIVQKGSRWEEVPVSSEQPLVPANQGALAAVSPSLLPLVAPNQGSKEVAPTPGSPQPGLRTEAKSLVPANQGSSASVSRRVVVYGLDSKPVCDRGFGALVVDVDEGFQLYANQREEKFQLQKSPSALFAFFQGKKGTRPRWEPLPAQPRPAQPKSAPAREQIVLTSGPSGVWDKVKERLTSKINPHTFQTWIHPTREHGAKADGTMVVHVPLGPFQKRLVTVFSRQIHDALNEVTKAGESQVEFVTDKDDIVPPGSVTAEQYSKSIARGGMHK